MWQRFPHNPSAYDDDWEDQPRQGWFYKWVLGILLPLLLFGYGAYGIATHEIVFRGSNTPMTLHGLNAVAYGVAWISAALFVHCHYFWGNIYNQAWFAVLGKIIGAAGVIAGLAVVLVRYGIFGIG